MGIIQSEVRLVGKDAGVGAMFDSIAAKIDRMSKNTKVSSPFSNLANDLTLAETKIRALDKVGSTKAISDIAKQRALVTKGALEQSRQLVAATEAPTKAMQRDLAAREAAHAKAVSIARREQTLHMQARQAVVAEGLSLHDLASQKAALTRQTEHLSSAMERQVKVDRIAATQAAASHAAAERRAHYLSHHGLAGTLLGAAAGAATVHGVLRVGEEAWEAGAERQHVLTGLGTAGMKPDEIARAEAQAAVVSRQAPNMSMSQILELHKEARSAVRHPEEAFELLPDLAKASSALKGMGNDGNVADLVKAGESLGLMSNPERFHRFLEGQVKAMQVFGRTISTDQIYEAAKYSKATGSTLSDDFLNGTLPSLIQKMHGSSAGDALSTLNTRLRGGLMHQHLSAKRMEEMGLLDDPSKLIRNKTGEIIGYSGKVKGDALLTSDPGKWFQTFFKDGAAKVGARSLEDVNKLLTEVLPGTAANLGRILIQQEESIRQHQENLHNATGLDETVRRQQEDWKAASGAFKASLEDLGAAFTGPGMGQAAKGLSWLSDEIRSFAKVAADHPGIAVPAAVVGGGAAAAGAAYLGWQFATAGVALQTSATMLDEAAIRLGASPLQKVLGGAGAAAEAGIVGAEGGAVIGGATGLAAGLGGAGLIAGLAWLIEKSSEAQRPGNGGAWAPATLGSLATDRYALAEQQDRLGSLQARADRARAASRFPDMPNPVLQQLEDEIADLRNQIAAREDSLARVPSIPIGPAGVALPTMAGYDVRRKRGGGISFPNVPLSSIGGNTFLTDGAPAVDVGKAGWGGPPAGPQTIDITGKIPIDAHVDTNVNVRILGLPDGVTAQTEFKSTATRVSTGPTMANAGRPAGHVGRGDM